MDELQLTGEATNGPRRKRAPRIRNAEKLGKAVEQVVEALRVLAPEARMRVLRSAAALYDIRLTAMGARES